MGCRGMEFCKGVDVFIKGDMAGDIDFIGAKVKTFVATVIGRKAKEDTRGRTSL